MIIQCPDCQTRFQLDPERVPRRQIRVRCSRCRYVFPVDGRMIDEAPVPSAPETASGASAPTPSVPSEPARESSRPVEPAEPSGPVSDGIGLEVERPGLEGFQTAREAATAGPAPESPSPEETPTSATATLDQEESPASSGDVEIEPAERQAPAPEPTTPKTETDPRTKKARRLARALVSDILVYNRELRDRALAEGNLVQALGPEIKKSWELYKEKVDPEFAKESDLFRQALNDILADGQTIF